MDPIADMFTIIRNAQAVKKETAAIPYSKIKMEIAKALLRCGCIKGINRRGKKNKKSVEIVLSYGESGNGVINHIGRISKPSRRVYFSLKEIKQARWRRGVILLSTPKGILTGKEAVKEKVGGEVLCEIW